MKYYKKFEKYVHYLAYANKLNHTNTPNVSLCEDTGAICVTPYISDIGNGHDYVDLGLPSGTLWATMNVGASSITDYGNHYMYGKGANDYSITYNESIYTGNEATLLSEYDTATQVWGGSWHMPTEVQCQELLDNTTCEWTTINGINGSKFTAPNGNYIFIPAAGKGYRGSISSGYTVYVWSSSYWGSNNSYYLWVDEYGHSVSTEYIDYGYSIRPVIG